MVRFRAKLGDCLDVMRDIPDNSFHSVVTDPPYGMSFMGKDWDHGVPGKIFWKEILRVSKPGSHLLAFGGTRTHHRLMVAIEDAGWEIRDTLMWVYSSGFPKSVNISKGIDKHLGAEREVIGYDASRARPNRTGKTGYDSEGEKYDRSDNGATLTASATDEAKQWEGWGNNLKPAWEPIVLARKPLSEKTIVENVLKWGTGGLNIDATRIETQGSDTLTPRNNKPGPNGWKNSSGGLVEPSPLGRWPANFMLECICEEVLIEGESGEAYSYSGREYNNKKTSMFNGDKPQSPSNYNDRNLSVTHTNPECPCYLLPQSKGQQGDVRGTEKSRTGGENTHCYGEYEQVPAAKRGDAGSAARFFYCPKTSKKDREEGNIHNTVKPTELMKYLCRLVTPPNGIVFDPFMGSGSTGKGALLEGFRFYGIDKEAEYVEIARKRLENAEANS